MSMPSAKNSLIKWLPLASAHPGETYIVKILSDSPPGGIDLFPVFGEKIDGVHDHLSMFGDGDAVILLSTGAGWIVLNHYSPPIPP